VAELAPDHKNQERVDRRPYQRPPSHTKSTPLFKPYHQELKASSSPPASTTPSLQSPEEPHCISTNTCWSPSFQCPDFYPKTPIWSSTFAPTNYTCARTPIPWCIFTPRNITTLEDLAFADLIEVRKRKKYYEVPVFYCEQLHMWFFPAYDTGYCLKFSKVTRALIKVEGPTDTLLLNEATQVTGICQGDPQIKGPST